MGRNLLFLTGEVWGWRGGGAGAAKRLVKLTSCKHVKYVMSDGGGGPKLKTSGGREEGDEEKMSYSKL